MIAFDSEEVNSFSIMTHSAKLWCVFIHVSNLT